MSYEAATAAVTAALPLVVASKVTGEVIRGVSGATRRRKTVAKKPKKVEKKEKKKEANKMEPKTKVIKGEKYTLTSTPRSKKDADHSVKMDKELFGRESVAVPVGNGKYVVYSKEPTKKGKVAIRTVKEKERSKSRTKSGKVIKAGSSRSGSIETRGGRGHIRL